ncbi:MAG: glycosyltransferase family 4 protein [Patescibacteria group bacterium]|nr:glycosyltransferase family 4 protein [Patescibacteria group bacterium]
MRILFLSRTYPPIIGGMENQNFELSKNLSELAFVKIIANPYGKKFLPVFLPYALIRTVISMRKFDVLLLGDGVMSVVGWAVKLFYGKRKKVVSVVHGLDLTYPLWIYQKFWIGKFIQNLDKLVAVGNETIRQGVKRNIPEEKFVFVPNGVDTEKFIEPRTKKELEKVVGESLEGKKTILTTGRLAIHKGVDWFCEKVVPELDDNILYLVAGDGEKREEIEKIIKEKNIQEKVKMLGQVSDDELKILYNTVDLYVKPNIKVPGTMEGFGLVVIEAASCKLTVVASEIEGLKDAIKDGENGFLVESANAQAWIAKINELLADDQFRNEFGEKARKYVVENYSWDKIAKKYLEVLENTLS